MLRLLAGSACALVSFSAASITALGATPSTTYVTVTNNAPDPETGGRWGERIVPIGDINGDGVADVVIGDPNATVNGLKWGGRVYVVDGKSLTTGSPTILYKLTSPNPETLTKFGFFISNIGDINGDQVADFAVGTDSETSNGLVRQGRVYIYSGKTGALLRTITDPDSTQPRARFGSRIGRADQLGDIIVGASATDIPIACGAATTLAADCHKGQGRAYIFNAATGVLIRTLDLPAADQPAATCSANGTCGSFGLAVQGPGDTDADGIADQLVSAPGLPNGGSMYVFSNAAVPGDATGQVRLRIDDPVPQPGALFGFQDAEPLAPGDVNGDGNADIFGDGFLQNGPAGAGQGAAWVFDGKTGKVLYTLADPHPTAGGQFGWSMVKTFYRKGATPDLYVGASPHHVAGVLENGDTNVFDGRDGTLLKSLPLPQAFSNQTPTETNNGPNLGWTVAAPGDLNGDGEPDYLAGAPFTDIGQNQDQGIVLLFQSSVPVTPTASATPTASPTASAAATSTSPAQLALTGGGHRQSNPSPLGWLMLFGALGVALLAVGAGIPLVRRRREG
ncbi:MAG: integrin alpha [Actinomycetota bacterium]|nr:integrin alpha [Actinomycetota bacterium]